MTLKAGIRGYRSSLMQGRIIKPLLIVVLASMLSACLPTTPLPPLPMDTLIPTSTGTPTVVWFPATPTNTIIPTIVPTPTPELRPWVGTLLLSDDFRVADHWLIGNMGKGTIALGPNELSLVLTQPRGYLFSFRDEPTLDDFYAEITASPSLCTGMDEYGLLVRYNSPVDFYRFSLSCNGQTRLDKLLGGSASSPQPWLGSTSIPTAAPSSSRIGIWVVGSEMRFFVNNEFQFSVVDRSLPRGMLGVFTRSAGETAVTVSFSDLVVYQIQQ
jgi:hypothetical protein